MGKKKTGHSCLFSPTANAAGSGLHCLDFHFDYFPELRHIVITHPLMGVMSWVFTS